MWGQPPRLSAERSSARLRYSHNMRLSILTLVLFVAPLFAQQSPDPHSIPQVDAELGACSANLTITDTADKPIYNAQIEVRVQYGTFHRIDLTVNTNVDGRARFVGLPANPKRGYFYRASEGDRTGNAFQDPAQKCNAQFTVVLRKSTEPPQQ